MPAKDLYAKLIYSPNPKAQYTNREIMRIVEQCGTGLHNTWLTNVVIHQLGKRYFAIATNPETSEMYGPYYNPDELREVGKIIQVYKGPDNKELCNMFGLYPSNNSQFEMEELVCACKNTTLPYFSIFRVSNGLTSVRHSGKALLDNGMLLACVEMANVSSESTARVEMALSYMVEKENRELDEVA
jgi:hypothetical protein